jgi:hypothetical protein
LDHASSGIGDFLPHRASHILRRRYNALVQTPIPTCGRRIFVALLHFGNPGGRLDFSKSAAQEFAMMVNNIEEVERVFIA